MVDPIGAKPIAASDPRRIAPVGGATRAQTSEATGGGETRAAVASSLTRLVRTMAAAPPVDTDRVARIRAAIADGSFPILPATIADRILAFKLDWKPDDAA